MKHNHYCLGNHACAASPLSSVYKAVEAKKKKHLAETLVLQINSTDEGPEVSTMSRGYHKEQTQHNIWIDAR